MANFSNPVTMDRVSTEKPWLLYIYIQAQIEYVVILGKYT